VALNRDDHSLDRVDIHRLVFADNDFSGTVSRRPSGGWQADIHGARLDIHRAAKRALEGSAPTSETPLAISARVAELVLGPHREARNVTATLLRDHGSWQTIDIDGHYANGHRVALSLGGAAGAGKLHLESDDLGATVALFGIADNVVGGKLTVDGTVGEVDGHQVIRARLDGSDYRLARAPALAQLLSLTSLEGIAAMMSGSGIPFTDLHGEVGFSRGVISLKRVIAYGGALGISAKGWLNPGEDQIDIDGTLAPAYALNSVLGNFPVLGSILTGGEGQGLFAARFHLGGSNDNPTVTVNPLSALTPGLLRHLFDPFSNPGQPGAAPPQAVTATTSPSPPSDTTH
ncbi:MAG TPA: AsmA-like C-terminal region-containing protein, partial [Stellaceae bacterium]|nr:AsmA-like C-terminal region-containing protein [Stellaceae bacterium]